MKLQAAMAVLAFVAVQAAAVPEAAPSNVRRDAAAEADPRRVRNWINFCGVPGNMCGRKRSAEPEPEARKVRNWINFCGVPGNMCGKARDAPETEVGNEVGYCGTPGQPCAMIKRSANAIAEALAEPEASPRKVRNWINFCGVPGNMCGKARDLIGGVVDHANDAYGAIYEREAEAHPEASAEAEPRRVRNWINFCGVPGNMCGRRRDAPELTEKIEKREAMAAADAEPRRVRNWINFCGVPGNMCGRKRDADAAAIAAAINKADPSIFKETCYAEGGECDKLLKIQKAFHKAKRENAEEAKLQHPKQKLAHCGGKNECTALTHAHQFAAQHHPRSAAEAEAACNGEEGLCTLARRDLESLEEAIDSAVDAMTGATEGDE